MTLVNGYLAFKYITDKEMTLREFTNSIALAMCAKEGMRWEGCPGRDTLHTADRHWCSNDAQVARGDPVQGASSWPWRMWGKRTVSEVPQQACIKWIYSLCKDQTLISSKRSAVVTVWIRVWTLVISLDWFEFLRFQVAWASGLFASCDWYWPAKSPMSASLSLLCLRLILKHFNLESSLGYAWLTANWRRQA